MASHEEGSAVGGPGHERKITNRIIYFPLISEDEQRDFSPFDALHVECEPCKVIAGNWEKAYCKIWEEIRRLEG